MILGILNKLLTISLIGETETHVRQMYTNTSTSPPAKPVLNHLNVACPAICQCMHRKIVYGVNKATRSTGSSVQTVTRDVAMLTHSACCCSSCHHCQKAMETLASTRHLGKRPGIHHTRRGSKHMSLHAAKNADSAFDCFSRALKALQVSSKTAEIVILHPCQ